MVKEETIVDCVVDTCEREGYSYTFVKHLFLAMIVERCEAEGKILLYSIKPVMDVILTLS